MPESLRRDLERALEECREDNERLRMSLRAIIGICRSSSDLAEKRELWSLLDHATRIASGAVDED